MTLIAEDVLLLLLDDEKGTVPSGVSLQPLLGGALLIELALAEQVRVVKDGPWRSAKVHVTDVAGPEDPVLADAWRTVAEKPRTAQDLVNRLGKGRKAVLADRLAQRGILQRRDEKVLGMFPRTRWPAADPGREEDLRRALTAALVEGQEPDPRTAALVALLHAVGRAHKTVPHEGMSGSAVRARAKEISEGAWAAKAVKDAITAAQAAVIAATAASTAAATNG